MTCPLKMPLPFSLEDFVIIRNEKLANLFYEQVLKLDQTLAVIALNEGESLNRFVVKALKRIV